MRYSLYQTTLIAARKIYVRLFPKDTQLKKIKDADEVSRLIMKKIGSGKPLMISRFGANELGCITNHIGIKNHDRDPWKYIKGQNPAWWIDLGNQYCMKNNAGFFPNDEESLYKFGELMLEDMKQIDILASWLDDEWRVRSNFPDADIIDFITLDPFWSKVPWTKALERKRVLVVHPFNEEIEYQYQNHRLEIHNGKEVLPAFQLETIKAVQSIGGNNNFKSWFDALDYMKSEIDKHDYDICLIGCGAYGMPLAAHVKRHGKQAVHMGGSLQLLFGIRGSRWETTEYGKQFFGGIGHYPDLMNDYWIRPYPKSKFEGADKVENACYW